jgi:hypothetical protein
MKITYLLSQPLDFRNRTRFGLDYWRNQGVEVSVFDLTPFQHPKVEKDFINRKNKRHTKKINFFYISSIKDFWKALTRMPQSRPWFAIDFMGSEISSSLLRIFLRSVKVSRIVLSAGCLPETTTKIFYKNQNSFKNICKLLFKKRFFERILNYLVKTFVPPQAEFTSSGFISATSQKQKPTKIFHIPSFDYDLYLKQQKRKTKRFLKGKYAVFLDEDMCFHPDFLYEKKKSPHFAENYFPLIKSLFENVEKKYKIRMVVAEHPRANYSKEQQIKYFGKRLVLQNKTNSLIKDCCLVLCHCSTAVSFATLYKKPIIFVTTCQLERSRYGEIISNFAHQLGSCKIKMEKNLSAINLPNIIRVNQKKYDNYVRNYICPSADCDGKPLWQIVNESMKDLRLRTTVSLTQI